jgi:hypothetical protein
MRVLPLCLMMGVLPLWAGGRPAPSIRLYTQFQQEPPEMVLGSLQMELRTILEPLGLGFEWRELDLSGGNEVSTELAVIHFKGSCDVENLAALKVYPGPLGWTHMSGGEVLPFTDISCDRVRLFMQRDLLRLPERDRQAAYGKAVGRVLAHELYHIFAKTAKHGSWGIAKAAYTVEELLCPTFQFEKRESNILRAHYRELLGFADNAGQ